MTAGEDTIEARNRLGDLLIKAKLIKEDDIPRALERMRTEGGRLGDNLVAIGAIDQRTLDRFIHRAPKEPKNIAETGIEEAELLALLMKSIYTLGLTTVPQYTDALKLAPQIVNDLTRTAIDRQLLYTLGTRNPQSAVGIVYALTEEGRRWTVDQMSRSGYVGPAPVPLADFVEMMSLQKPTNERISPDRVRNAVKDLVLADDIVEQTGPALNSGRAILLYGAPGNGKTSVALSFASVFSDIIYVPYAVWIEGQIIRFYDPRVHIGVSTELEKKDDGDSFIRRETYDMRWVACKRPFVITGGELTLEMLDLRYDREGHYYEAPLHMKALGGCFFIDDFGRQLVSPASLLNRWIVPLENRVDYMKLHTGKTFSIPFEELVIFSTNLEPESLMDPAFLRRLPYKIEVIPPNLVYYRSIFERECARHGLALRDDVFKYIVYLVKEEMGMELAAYHPKFIVDQVVATCRFLGEIPELRSPYVDYAINNLGVKKRARHLAASGQKPEADDANKNLNEETKSGAESTSTEPSGISSGRPEASSTERSELAMQSSEVASMERLGIF